MKQLSDDNINELWANSNFPKVHNFARAVITEFCRINNLEAQPAAEDKAGGEPVAWVRWDDDEKYWDVRRNAPSQEAVAYLAKWNRPPWVPAYPQPQAIPAGYAIVPVEPTPEMLSAGYCMVTINIETSANALEEPYRAMIAAAPKVK